MRTNNNEKVEPKGLKKLEQDFNQTFASGHGKRVLAHIMRECGFMEPSVTINNQTSEINMKATLYNEARRNVYLSIRKFIRPDIIREIETPIKGD